MAVDEAVSAYSTTANSNTPQGTDAVGPDLDNHLRDIKKNIKIIGENFKSQSSGFGIPGALRVDPSASPTWTLSLRGLSASITLFDIDESAGLADAYIGGAAPGPFLKGFAGESTASARATVMGPLGATAGETGTASAQLRFMGATIGAAAGQGSAASAQSSLGLAYATSTEMQSASATNRVASPGNIVDHPAAAKAWAVIDGSATASIGSAYNISGATRSAEGVYKISWTTPFATDRYAVMLAQEAITSSTFSRQMSVSAGSQSAGGVQVVSANAANNTKDDAPRFHIIAFGTQ